MRIVIALGGNALLRRSDPMTTQVQRRNIEVAARAIEGAVAVIAITVLLSVVAHGATAEPLAARYAKLLAHRAARSPSALMPDMPDRRLIRRSSPLTGDTRSKAVMNCEHHQPRAS